MDEGRMRRLVATARVARLATVRPDGRPHVVPITFALADGQLVTAVDHKPKTTSDLQRLRNIEAEPRVSVLVDRYDNDWSRLWWVRIDGTAHILTDGVERDRLAAVLAERYVQYADDPPEGPVIEVVVTAWRGWTADPQ